MKKRPLVLATTVAAAIAAVAIDRWLDHSYFPGYAALIGFAGCAVIIVASKWLGKLFIQRPESYWPADVPADRQEDLRG